MAKARAECVCRVCGKKFYKESKIPDKSPDVFGIFAVCSEIQVLFFMHFY